VREVGHHQIFCVKHTTEVIAKSNMENLVQTI
jgi:hypothetical protein